MRSYLVAVLLSVSGLLCAADPVIDQIFADPPVAVSDVSTGVVEDIALPIPAATLLANDTDAQIDTLSVVGASSALGGTATVAAGVLAFTSARNTTGANTLPIMSSINHRSSAPCLVPCWRRRLLAPW